jgi:hypothetical protein
MKIAVKALKQLLTDRIAEETKRIEKDKAQTIRERTKELQERIRKAKGWIDKAELRLASGDVLERLSGPSLDFYAEHVSQGELGTAKRALKVLELVSQAEITVAEASKIVGEALTDFV